MIQNRPFLLIVEADKKYLGHNIFLKEAILHHNILFVCRYTINIIARPVCGNKSNMQENNIPNNISGFEDPMLSLMYFTQFNMVCFMLNYHQSLSV